MTAPARQADTPASRPQRFSTPPMPAQEGDSNEWITGDCWLYCGRRNLSVLWIGVAQTHGAAAPLYACGPCLQRLTDRVHAHHGARDRPTYRAS